MTRAWGASRSSWPLPNSWRLSPSSRRTRANFPRRQHVPPEAARHPQHDKGHSPRAPRPVPPVPERARRAEHGEREPRPPVTQDQGHGSVPRLLPRAGHVRRGPERPLVDKGEAVPHLRARHRARHRTLLRLRLRLRAGHGAEGVPRPRPSQQPSQEGHQRPLAEVLPATALSARTRPVGAGQVGRVAEAACPQRRQSRALTA